MEPRLQYSSLEPALMKAMIFLEQAVQKSGIDRALLELVKLRASQINGCAFCIDMHWKDARHRGETEQRLYGLNAWKESPYYTEKERAAFAWTEALTLVAETHAPDSVFDALREHFSDEDIVRLTYAIATINSWNRLAIAMRSKPGEYKPG